MKLGDHEAEIRFAAKIDCEFPYRDHAMAAAIIDEGWSLSMDAAFAVLHEICRKPESERVTQKRQHDLVDEWAANFEHPLKEPMLRCARALIEKDWLPWDEAVMVMKQIERFEGQYAALNIAYFSGDGNSYEGDTELETTRERILAGWD